MSTPVDLTKSWASGHYEYAQMSGAVGTLTTPAGEVVPISAYPNLPQYRPQPLPGGAPTYYASMRGGLLSRIFPRHMRGLSSPGPLGMTYGVWFGVAAVGAAAYLFLRK